MEMRDPSQAFDNAIQRGTLSDDESAENYAGNFMYMGTAKWVVPGFVSDSFKNINTRKYLFVPAA